MTGLALLAFLASGQTHRDGPHRTMSAVDWNTCLSVQATDGNLAGRADLFARMYSHAMAAFALSEAYGMTGDLAAARRASSGQSPTRWPPRTLTAAAGDIGPATPATPANSAGN